MKPLPEQMVTTPDGVTYDLLFLNRMVDYAAGVRSLPESCAKAAHQLGTFGFKWNQIECDCKLYAYPHGGCPGPRAADLPAGWRSGDNLNTKPQAPPRPTQTVEEAMAAIRFPKL